MDAVVLVISDSAGIYIPQEWAESCHGVDGWSGYDEEDVETVLEGPEHEWYWEAWDNILTSAQYRPPGSDPNEDNYWALYQDGDLWLVNYDKMTREEKLNFEFDLEDEEREAT